MAVLTITALAIVATAPVANADAGWTKVYDQPTPIFSGVEMFDDARGIAGSAGALYHTIDGGATWLRSAPDSAFIAGSPFGGVSFISYGDADHAWIAGSSGQLLATADGGATFAAQRTGTDAHFNSVSAVSATEAWAAAFGEGFSDIGPAFVPASVLLHTTDGGATWRQERLSGYGVFNQVDFADQRDGWLLASTCIPGQRSQDCPHFDASALLATTDAGATWDPVPLPDGGRPQRAQLFAGGHGFVESAVCANSGNCRLVDLATDDGGAHWRPLTLPARESEWRFVTADRGYLIEHGCAADGCPHGRVFETTDMGAQWRLVATQQSVQTFASFDATSTHIIVPGGSTGILRIDPATHTVAEAVTGARDAFYSIAFASHDRAYATNRDGLWLSGDGGATWTPRTTPIRSSAVSAPSPNVVWIGGSDVTCPEFCTAIFRSVDGGETWSGSAQRLGSRQGLQAFDSTRAWAWGDDGLWRTDDSAASWQLVSRESGPWTFIDRDHGFAADCARACDGEFLFTSDGGTTIERRPVPDRARPDFFLTPEIGWASGELRDEAGGCQSCFAVWATADGGATWRETARTGDRAINGMLFADTLHGWALSSGGQPYTSSLVATEDGGVTWTEDLPGASGHLTARDGRLWLANANLYGPGSPARTTIWRRDYAAAPTITAPDAGTGPSHPSTTRRWSTAASAALLGAILLVFGCVIRRRMPSG